MRRGDGKASVSAERNTRTINNTIEGVPDVLVCSLKKRAYESDAQARKTRLFSVLTDV